METNQARVAFVYRIETKFSSRIYIGKSCRPSKRLREHFRSAKGGKSMSPLHKAMRVHDESDFVLSISSQHASNEEAYSAEETAIAAAALQGVSLFNLNGGGTGQRLPSPETRMKMSASQKNKKMSEESRRKISMSTKGVRKPESQRIKLRARRGPLHPHFGKKIHSDEQRAKWSRERLGRKIGPMAQEARDNISASRIAKGTAAGEKNPRWKGDDAAPRTKKQRAYTAEYNRRSDVRLRRRQQHNQRDPVKVAEANLIPTPFDSWLL